jgi:hypothetical protein
MRHWIMAISERHPEAWDKAQEFGERGSRSTSALGLSLSHSVLPMQSFHVL